VKLVAQLGLSALLVACATDAGGPRTTTVGVRVTDENDVDEVVLCVRVPVLLGSRVREVREVPSGFRVELSASRDWVEVKFPGAADAGVLRASDEQLENGHSDNLAIVDADGASHVAYLITGCSLVSAE
jgi:hypothetical protein